MMSGIFKILGSFFMIAYIVGIIINLIVLLYIAKKENDYEHEYLFTAIFMPWVYLILLLKR